VGAVAGACTKVLLNEKNEKRATASTIGETVAEITREKGPLGLWAGYSASLVLAFNPSMTFLLQQMLKRVLIAPQKWNKPGQQATFLLAALSKVAVTSVTYPLQLAKTRETSGLDSIRRQSSDREGLKYSE